MAITNPFGKGSPTYIANHQYGVNGKQVFDAFEEETKHPMELNKGLLFKLLNDNKDTEYGKKYHFADIHSVEDYQKNVPVITYDDVASEIERMLNGEKNILTAYEVGHMNETSGTVGNPKHIPMTTEQSDVYAKYNCLLNYGIMDVLLKAEWRDGRMFCTSSGNCKKMESGITVGEASAKMADYIKGGPDKLDEILRTIYTTPIEGVNPVPGIDTKYVHTRFALMEKYVKGLITGFYSVAVLFFTYIADNYEILISDIEKGTIDDSIDMPDEVRNSLLKKIKPMPERAAELREAFKDGPDLFVKKVWPEFCYISGCGGDGFSVYDKTIKEKFTGGEGVLNLYSGITASEGLWSVPFEFNNTNSCLAPQAAFLEFLPVEAGSDFSQCVTMDKLEVGKVYELIVTNLAGLFRYRMSDAVMVTGYYNATPTVQFMYRVNRTINLAEEKTTEKALQICVEKTAEELGFELSDFSVYPNTDVTPNRYDFLIEPRKEVTGITRKQLSECVFKHLVEANPVYMECYEDHWLDAPQCWFLQPQSSLLYRDMMVYKGASLNQLKPVRVIMNEVQRKFFFGLRDMDIE